jgi:hypothetical protein
VIDDETYAEQLVDEARRAAAAYARMDPQDKLRRFVAQNLIVGPDLARILLDRLDKRDGCHGRHNDVEAAARYLLDVLASTTRPPQPAIDAAATALRMVLGLHGAAAPRPVRDAERVAVLLDRAGR